MLSVTARSFSKVASSEKGKDTTDYQREMPLKGELDLRPRSSTLPPSC
jgi:hypothetical protein